MTAAVDTHRQVSAHPPAFALAWLPRSNLNCNFIQAGRGEGMRGLVGTRTLWERWNCVWIRTFLRSVVQLIRSIKQARSNGLKIDKFRIMLIIIIKWKPSTPAGARVNAEEEVGCDSRKHLAESRCRVTTHVEQMWAVRRSGDTSFLSRESWSLCPAHAAAPSACSLSAILCLLFPRLILV